MATFPIILDSLPAYLAEGGSLLLAPLGGELLLSHLQRITAEMTQEKLTVLTNFEPDENYEAALRGVVDGELEQTLPIDDFAGLLNRYETSDALLFLNAARFPAEASELKRVITEGGGRVRHLIALDRSAGGTRECAQLEQDGSVSRIQRYYEGVTWFSVAGVACSLVPVSALRLTGGRVFRSLTALRKELAESGLPCHDLLLAGGLWNLNREQDLLALNERAVIQVASGESAGLIQGSVDPEARLCGSVIVQAGAVVEAGALIVGPAVLGKNCRVERDATVAQSVVLPGTSVPAGTTLRHRVWNGRPSENTSRQAAYRHHEPKVYFVDAKSGTQAGTVTSREGERSMYPTIKRAVDLVLVTLGLTFISPILVVTAILIKLTSPGPVFFGHGREGKDGKIFKCWKFRTMAKDADRLQRTLRAKSNVDGPQFKMDHDPRITRIGRFLRTSNIDELPQLFNVLTGEMSLIGPRPSPFQENQICVPWRQARLSVQPGITGLWQVCRHEREAGDFHQWIYYDMLYVRHLSFDLDVKILLATLLTLGGRWSVPLSWLLSVRELEEEVLPARLTEWPPRLAKSGL
jgi:lipopolysaccharide/colanic/teichoic acid biosynthesis glycosyltransferase